MKRILLNLSFLATTITLINASVFAQTPGNLTFTFTQVAHSPCYTGTKNVLAVWIQTSTGTFVKTKIRNAGGGTSDHLPTWASNSGGPSNNCMSASCNTVSATTGATLSNFGTKTIQWDGTDVNGNIVADGTYKVTIQETWNHGAGSTVLKSYTFVKGSTPDIQSPADDANFSSVSLQWQPSGAGIEENAVSNGVTIYPNPSIDGVFTINYDKANSVKVVNMVGETVHQEELTKTSGSVNVDLSGYTAGIYIVYLTDGDVTTEHKIVIGKQ